MRFSRLISFPLITLAIIPLFIGCSGNKSDQKKEPKVEQIPHLDFSAQDSSNVKTLAAEYVAAFEGKDYAAAANLLYKYESDSVRPLTNQERDEFVSTMNQLPNFGCKLHGITMLTENNNRLQYLLQVTPDGNIDEEKGVMKFYLNPVLVDGNWYLTLLDMNQEGTRDIFKK